MALACTHFREDGSRLPWQVPVPADEPGTTRSSEWRPPPPLPEDIRAAGRTAAALRIAGTAILVVTLAVSVPLLPAGGWMPLAMTLATGVFGAFCLYGLASILDCLWHLFRLLHKESARTVR